MSRAAERPPAWTLPLLLFGGFRTLIDTLHERLAAEGHPDLRPSMGFAMQAVGPDGATAVEVGRRLGVSKQAAGKTIDRLTALGYVERATDPADARRKLVRLSRRGVDALNRSARIFAELRAEWDATVGARRVAGLEDVLQKVVPPGSYGLDGSDWLTR